MIIGAHSYAVYEQSVFLFFQYGGIHSLVKFLFWQEALYHTWVPLFGYKKEGRQ